MKNAPVRHRVEYGFYLAAKRALLSLPHSAVRRAGHGLGSLGYALLGSRRRLALDNLALALPELGEAERRRVARGAFRQFGASLCEVISASRLGPEGIGPRFDVEGEEHLEAARVEGKGLFLMTGHFGPWEVAAYPLGERFHALHLVARPPDNPFVAADLERMRARFGNRLITKAGAGHRMLNVVRKGGTVGILIDQRVRAEVGVLVPFFGHEVWTSPVLAYLSLLTRIPVLPAFCTPRGKDRYLLRFLPAITPDAPAPDREAETALTARYLAVVEEEIRRQPEMWLWMHRRWQR
jgi:Kdo2-lipid IVA lauroyltransferase/acyltransferase